MAPVVLSIVAALVAATAVIGVATAAAGPSGGAREFVRLLRSGLRRGVRRQGVIAGLRAEMTELADTEPGSVDDLFAVGRPARAGYVDPAELTRPLERATAAVRRRPER